MTVLPVVILGGLAALSLLVFGGKKEEKTPGATPPAGAPPSPPPTTDDSATWRKWVEGLAVEAAQTGSVVAAETAANTIESTSVGWTGDLKALAMQAVASLRAMAASWRADETRPPSPPPLSIPVNPPPPPPPVGIPSPPPIQSPPAEDFGAWIMQQVTDAGSSGVATTADHAANVIEGRIPSMPVEYHARARQAVTALRQMASSLRVAQQQQPAPVVPPPVYVPPSPPPPPPDPVLSSRAALAERMTMHLKQNGGAPANRYKEDQGLVRQYQSQEGLTADGKYGVGTGLSVVKYGIVPARPYYFSSNTTKTRNDKAEWTRIMNEMAASDPARASEWRAAANVASL